MIKDSMYCIRDTSNHAECFMSSRLGLQVMAAERSKESSSEETREDRRGPERRAASDRAPVAPGPEAAEGMEEQRAEAEPKTKVPEPASAPKGHAGRPSDKHTDQKHYRAIVGLFVISSYN